MVRLWLALLEEEDESELLIGKFGVSKVPLPHWCEPEIPCVLLISFEFPIIFLLSSMGVARSLRNKLIPSYCLFSFCANSSASQNSGKF